MYDNSYLKNQLFLISVQRDLIVWDISDLVFNFVDVLIAFLRLISNLSYLLKVYSRQHALF